MTRRLAFIYGGSLPERRFLDEPSYRRWFAEIIYLPDLAEADLHDVDVLYVPEGSHHGCLRVAAGRVRGLLERRGTIVVFGDQPSTWLPGLRWEYRPVSASGPLVAANLDHDFHQHITAQDASWHHHGVLYPPDGSRPLLATCDGESVLYVDQATTPGTLLAATLDPVSHFGSTFLPAARRFLDRFLPWVARAQS